MCLVDLCIGTVKRAYDEGISAIDLRFPRINKSLKDDFGSYAIKPNNLLCKTISDIKKVVLNIGIIADIVLDPYTIHGHDGVLDTDGLVDNGKTVEILTKQALILADAGCDILAHS